MRQDYFLDPMCTVPSAESRVDHGQFCHIESYDGHDNFSKYGCAYAPHDNSVQVHYLDYDPADNNECRGQPRSEMMFPLQDDHGMPVMGGECHKVDKMWARTTCANKDLLQHEPGLHILE